MADDADMRNELSDMQQRADQLADEVSFTPPVPRVGKVTVRTINTTLSWKKKRLGKHSCV